MNKTHTINNQGVKIELNYVVYSLRSVVGQRIYYRKTNLKVVI